MALAPESRYKIPSLEKPVNKFIGFVFYYRLMFVILSLGVIIFFDFKVWTNSDVGEKLKNAVLVLTGGSIMIGIFYSIINYEHNQIRFKHDKKILKETLTYSTACKMYETEMMRHFSTILLFFTKYKDFFEQGKFNKLYSKINNDTEIRSSFVIVFNYLEGISIGIEQGIMDEVFMKAFFNSIFRTNYVRYGRYIIFLRNRENSPNTFIKFTDLAQKWIKE